MKKVNVFLQGGLGNNLFQYALALHLSKLGYTVNLVNQEHELYSLFRKIELNNDNYFKKRFSNNINLLIKKQIKRIKHALPTKLKRIIVNPKNRLPHGNEKLTLTRNNYLYEDDLKLNPKYPRNLNEIEITGNVLIGFWLTTFFADDVYNQLISNIRQEYKFQRVARLKSNIDFYNSVAIHIRGGDYLSEEYFNILTSDYYLKAIKYFNRYLASPKYYVFTDDLIFAKKILKSIKEDFVFIKDYKFNHINEFKLLMSFKHYIIANSTYSWWASYLSTSADKSIVAPKYLYNGVINNLITKFTIII